MEDEYPDLKIKITPLNWPSRPLRLPPGWTMGTETINLISYPIKSGTSKRIPTTEED